MTPLTHPAKKIDQMDSENSSHFTLFQRQSVPSCCQDLPQGEPLLHSVSATTSGDDFWFY